MTCYFRKVPAVTACDVIIDYNNNNDTTGKFTMLKTCNSLLRKLSKSYDTEFCGRILLFLATIYPISERSAVNLMGKVNVNNVTFYEDEETYNQNMSFVEAQKAEHVSLWIAGLISAT